MEQATWENTEPFVPEFTTGKVIKVYDGDSVTVAAVVTGKIYRFSVRLVGIDTPELRSSNPVEKTRAKHVQQQLHDLIFDKYVTARILDNDKYGGRVLGDLWTKDGLHVNKYMLDSGFAVPYHGATKRTWTNEMLGSM